MSETIAPIDLSIIPINGTSKVDLTQLKTAWNNPTEQSLAHIRLYNDSGSTLQIRSDDGRIQDYVPAGAWLTYPIDHSIQSIDFTVISILPNPPIQLLMPTYFSPGEEVPGTPQLGNSPVGGSVSQVTSVVQTGQPVGTPVLSATPSSTFMGGTQEALIENDGTASFGSFLGGQRVGWDNQGNENVHSLTENGGGIKGTAPLTLLGGNEETGYCGASFEVGGSVASAIGPTVNAKVLWPTVPSSITLGTPIENAGASSPAAADINKYGFWLAWTATTINSISRYTNTYLTVGI